MTTPSALAKYQALIDTLVERNECILARRIADGDLWPEQASNSKFNALVTTLSQEHRNLLAELLQSARNGGIHDVLVVLSEKMNLQNLKLVQDGEEIPNEPYGTEMYWDWAARSAGEDWPRSAS
jgi:hypothetical protein